MRRATVVMGLVALAVAGAAQADTLFSSGFEVADGYVIATLWGQDGWFKGAGPDTPTDGQIVDDGTGNQVMQIMATNPGWGCGSKRNYDIASTKRYLIVEMDFMRKDAIEAFMFMDNNGPEGSPKSIFWDWGMDESHPEYPNELDVSSNAWPDTNRVYYHYELDEWHHVGLEVDQDERTVTRFNFDGTWYDENDMSYTPDHETVMAFRSYSGGSGGERLWIDNVVITDNDGCGAGDVDCNGVVDGLDLTAVLTAWETEPGDLLWNENADLDDNDIVDGLDLTEVISNWTVASSAAASSAAPEESEAAKPGKRLGNVRKER